MQVVYRRCCGLDVHMDVVTACVLILGENGAREVRKKEFRTDLKSLYNLMLWLFACKVEHAAMESTGVYWKPLWNVLEGQIPVLLANPYHMKNIPGRKTDQNDAEWIADLLAHGLLRASFVPPREIRDLRDLTRYRVKLTQECNRVHNRIEKILEDANIKLGSVASDILGVSGREMISRIAAGCERPDEMADLAINRLHASRAEVRRALYGRVRDHHRYMLQQLLEDLEHVEAKILRVEAEIIRQMQPYEEPMRRLLTIPGINVITTWTLIAELGVDMTKFADADHAASWAGLVPGNHESAGKRKSGRTRYGNRWLRRALCQSAWAVSHKKDCHLTAFFFRQASRRGEKKANIATAHRLLVIAFHILQDGSEYRESGGDVYDRLHPERTRKRLTRRLQRLGFEVSLRPIDEPLSELPAPRPRGRPCKCAERGLSCSHLARKSEGLEPKNPEDSAF